ncbi:hypothetical protein EVJ58_g4883 [Rhodofomes roseus]|uniref:Ubiquitin-like protease family profile domain-containing protein n=1 Tax=Rhodofomes roseus TaxID=34475 RepID=A0A4Y9YGZ9_9APHY|nr:hypothetical protein EVJ58_g4883 [Rhodofomes roseus]
MAPTQKLNSKPTDSGIFRANDWIKKNQQFIDPPRYVQDALTDLLSIPSTLEKTLFPTLSMSVGGALRVPAAVVPIYSTAGVHYDDLAEYPLSEYFSAIPPVHVVPTEVFRNIPIPSAEVTDELLRMVGQRWLDGNVSLLHRHLGRDGAPGIESPFMPMYVLKVWQMTHKLRPVITTWLRADNWTTGLNGLGPVIAQTRLLLTRIPWSGRFQGLEGEPDTSFLTTFLSRKWLASDHINAFLEAIQTKIDDSPPRLSEHGTHRVLSTWFAQILQGHHLQVTDSGALAADSPASTVLPEWMKKIGDGFLKGELLSVGLVVNLHRTHWVATVIQFGTQQILYADSFDNFDAGRMDMLRVVWEHATRHSSESIIPLPLPSLEPVELSCLHDLSHAAHSTSSSEVEIEGAVPVSKLDEQPKLKNIPQSAVLVKSQGSETTTQKWSKILTGQSSLEAAVVGAKVAKRKRKADTTSHKREKKGKKAPKKKAKKPRRDPVSGLLLRAHI